MLQSLRNSLKNWKREVKCDHCYYVTSPIKIQHSRGFNEVELFLFLLLSLTQLEFEQMWVRYLETLVSHCSYGNLAEAACQLDADSAAVKASMALKTRAV